MIDLLIGVDVGTSALKAVLVTADGHVLATAERRYSLERPAPGYALQRAEDWWKALAAAVRAVTEGQDKRAVRALGLSTQGGTLQPVDARGLALCPAISWMDTRAAAQEAEFRTRIGAKQVQEITGWGMCGGLNALQILWLRQNSPDIFKRTEQFLSVPGYLTQRLTGRAAVDYSSAGVEQLLDVRAGRWSEPILALLEIAPSRLAELVPAHESVGELTADAAEALGLPRHVAVAAGGHDQYCALLGAGATSQSDRLIATGTAWATVAVLDSPDAGIPEGAAISRHVVPDLWGALFSLDGGGSSLEWLCRALTPAGQAELVPLEQLGRLAAAQPAGADGLTFYPYFTGAEYPAGLRKANAGFLGLTFQHGAGHMARAIMEGVACQAVWMLQALGGAADGALILTGGASKSALWTGMIADIAGRTLTLPAIPEAGCLGAAALAGTAARVYQSPAEGAAQLAGMRRLVEPGPDRVRYRLVYERYQKGAARMAPLEGQ